MKKEIIHAAFKKTTIYFPPDLHKWLKTIAAQRGVTMTELIVRAVDRDRMEEGFLSAKLRKEK